MSDGLLERVSRLEALREDLIETISALSRVVGPGEVQAKVGEIRREKMADVVAKAVKTGKLEKRDRVLDDCLVVGFQVAKNGQTLFPGRFQVFVKELVADVKALVLDSPADSTVKLKDGGLLKILEVYGPPTPQTENPPTPPKAKPKKDRKKK